MNKENRDGKTLSKKRTSHTPATDTPQIVPPKTVTAMVSRLLCVYKAPMDKNHARVTKSSIRGLKSTLTTDPAFSANFNINELESALKSVKLETAAGFDGVYPKFIRNCGKRTKEWLILIAFMNDVLSSARLPKLFKRAKVIAIPKPGKNGSDPAHY
jgi:hypothetical protein